MPDVFSSEKRSEIMARVRNKNTKPELLIRKELHKRGLRYKLHDTKLPGKPDLSFPRFHTVLFVNGCFWHGHDDCSRSALPKSNHDRWAAKIATNKERDKTTIIKLQSLGWRAITVWTCEIRSNQNFFDELCAKILSVSTYSEELKLNPTHEKQKSPVIRVSTLALL